MAGQERQNRRVQHGTLLIVALVAISVLIFMLDDIIELFRRKYEVVAIVRDAAGIVDGSAVWIGGKEVGVVTTVAFLPAGSDTTARIALTLELPRRLQDQVREDSRVRMTSARLIGARAVDIVPGSATAPVLAAGDTLDQDSRRSVKRLTAQAKDVRTSLDSVLTELSALAPTAQLRLAQTQQAFASLDLAAAELRQLRGDLAASPGSALLADPGFSAALDRARGHAAELPAAIAMMRERSGPAAEVAAALAQLQTRADSLAARLDTAAAMVGPNSSLSRFQQDSALAGALRAAKMDLDSLVVEVRRNPLRFVF
jgi:ABC-type transporter Mla subunit MlaD